MSGDVVGFALGRNHPGDLLYVTGDTVWFDGTVKVAHRYSPAVVLMFTGAAEPRSRFHMTMGSEDALEAAHAFRDATLVAAHNEGWVHIRETQAQLAEVFERFGLAERLAQFERGVPLSFPLPPRRPANA
jgi:L-ascorbate metabolism protein UlaG (beta-lactamase superfamily)